MNDDLIEAVVSPVRERSVDGVIQPAPEWFDLDADGRTEAFEAAAVQRRLEAALDPDGLSATSRAVLARLNHASQ